MPSRPVSKSRRLPVHRLALLEAPSSPQARAERAAAAIPKVAQIVLKYVEGESRDSALGDLARTAAHAAVQTIGEAYRDPHVSEAALTAARMALGIQQIPIATTEGEKR